MALTETQKKINKLSLTQIGAVGKANIDREIYRRIKDGYYSPSIYVTADDKIAIQVKGMVFVDSVEQWHKAMDEYRHRPPVSKDLGAEAAAGEIEQLYSIWRQWVELNRGLEVPTPAGRRKEMAAIVTRHKTPAERVAGRMLIAVKNMLDHSHVCEDCKEEAIEIIALAEPQEKTEKGS